MKVSFYTGLPNLQVLHIVHDFAVKVLNPNCKGTLTTFQELAVTLSRLRLNLNVNDLAYRLDVSASTVTRAFHKWLEILFRRFQKTIKWPEREQLIETTPMCFWELFGTHVATVIDCFEVFINRPSDVKARAQIWSSYKHHNTAKFLIGICPQGVISYISRAWGGRASDTFITEHCGICNIFFLETMF